MDNELRGAMPKASSQHSLHKYRLAVITKDQKNEAFGIAVEDACDPDALCIMEIGSNRQLALTVVDTLNYYRVPLVHFPDVVNDMINSKC